MNQATLHRPSAHLMLIALACAAVFANTLHNGFHLDDYYRVVDNPGIQQVSRPWIHFIDPSTMATIDRILGYRPLLPLSLSINYAIAGNSLVGYHVGNIVLQFIAAALVYLLARRLCADATPLVALCASLLFAVHPVSGIAVNYICARDQLISQAFMSASLLCYLNMRARGFRWRQCLVALGCFELSLLAKGDTISLSGVVLAAELTLFQSSWRSPWPWLRAALFGVPVLALLGFQRFVLGMSEVDNVVTSSTLGAWAYPLTQAKLHLFHYLPHFFWPFSMRQDPAVQLLAGFSWTAALGLAFVLGSSWLAWHGRRRQPLVAFCVLSYWVLLAPTSSFVSLHHVAVDYRPYPASPFFFIALCHVAAQWLRDTRWRQVLAWGAISFCALSSVSMNRIWRDDQTLWSHSVRHGGGALAHLNLAMASADVPLRRALLDKALQLAPDYVLAKVNLGLTWIAAGEQSRGLALLERTTREAPYDAQAHYWYARALIESGRRQEAFDASVRAAELDARNARTVYQAVLAAQAVERHDVALRWLDVSDRLTPAEAEAPFARGFSLQQLGRLDEAILTYRRFLQRTQAHVQARFNLGCALEAQQRFAQAAAEFERVLELAPSTAAAHLHLARCSRALGRTELAQVHQATWDRARHMP